MREKRKAELHAGVDERVGKLKEKLHVVLTRARVLAEARRPQGRRASRMWSRSTSALTGSVPPAIRPGGSRRS